MSIKLMAEVWATPFPTATTKLAILAIADFANDEGRCFPSIAAIASKCDISDRQVQRIIKWAVSQGLLEILTRASHHVTSVYLLRVRGDKVSPLKNESGVTSTTSGVTSADIDSSPSLPHTPSLPEPSVEPSYKDAQGVVHPRRGRAKKTPDPRVKEVLSTIETEQGYPIANWGKEGAAVKQGLTLGYTPEQVIDCWRKMKGFAFWQGKALPLASVTSNLGEFAKGELREFAGNKVYARPPARRVEARTDPHDFDEDEV